MADGNQTLQRGHPVDILVQILHGNVLSTAEEVISISHRIRECRTFLESLHPIPILSPITQRQQFGAESQEKSQLPGYLKHQGSQAAVDTVNVQNTRTVLGRI
jgi:hypothetical protein